MTLGDWPLARRVERTNLPIASPKWPSLRCRLAREIRRADTHFVTGEPCPRTDCRAPSEGNPRSHDWSLGGCHLDAAGCQLVTSWKAEAGNTAAVSGNWPSTRNAPVGGMLLKMEGSEWRSPGRSLSFPPRLLAPPSTRSPQTRKQGGILTPVLVMSLVCAVFLYRHTFQAFCSCPSFILLLLGLFAAAA